jgi:TP901-1 family phage major tail protein
MASFQGRELLLKIGDGASPEAFLTLGAARATAVSIDNQPAESTATNSAGIASYIADAGVQDMRVSLEGLFRDQAAEERLRAAAFARTLNNYRLVFPNGDSYAAAFAVESYARGGSVEGFETFSVRLRRSGAGTFTAGA